MIDSNAISAVWMVRVMGDMAIRSGSGKVGFRAAAWDLPSSVRGGSGVG